MTSSGQHSWRIQPLRAAADDGRSGSAREYVPVRVSAEPGTELLLIDSFLKRQANGIGHLDATVPPGIYKVRALRFGHRTERLIEVTKDTPLIEIKVKGAISILPTVKSTGNYTNAFSEALAQINAAHEELQDTGLATVYVFAFVGDGADARVVERSRYFPWGKTDKGASLEPQHIRQVPVVDGVWHVARVNLKPGPNVLEINDGRAKQRVMLPVLAGAELHLGLRITSVDAEGALTAVEVAVQARREETLSGQQRPDWQHYLEFSNEIELDNAARYSLARRRYLVLDDELVMKLLNLKFRAPFTGLAAAHLMFDSIEEQAARRAANRPLGVLQNVRFGENLTATVLRNMTHLMSLGEANRDIGTPGSPLPSDPPASPDLVAIYLRSGRFWRARAKIEVPPLFARSWEVLQRPEYAERVEISPALWSRTKMNREMGPYFCWTPMRMSVRDFVDRYAWLDEEMPGEELGAEFEDQIAARTGLTKSPMLSADRSTSSLAKFIDERNIKHRLKIPSNVIKRLL